MSVLDAANKLWSYTYNIAGQLTDVAPPNTAPHRTWTYNPTGTLAQASDPESGTTTFTYDAAGRLASQQDARGNTVSYILDAYGRLYIVDAPGTAEDVTIGYDGRGNVTSLSNATVATGLTYDAENRLTNRTDQIAGHDFVQTFTYDGLDRLVEQTYPLTGRWVKFTYVGSRLNEVKTWAPGETERKLASSIGYWGDGTLASFNIGTSTTADWSLSRDVRQRPLHLQSGPLDLTYTYDYVGNVTQIVDGRGSSYNSTFTYDDLDRLKTEGGARSHNYYYDELGNRTSADGVNFNYNSYGRLSSLSGVGSFSYDDAGNLTNDPSGVSYTYTALNRLASATLGSAVTTYGYGPDGSRAKRVTSDGVTHVYVRGPAGLIGEYTLNGSDVTVVREYVGGGSPIQASISPGTVFRGLVTLLTPTDGQAVGTTEVISLTAAVQAPSGVTVTRVEYYMGGMFVGSSSTATGHYAVPWRYDWISGTSFKFVARLVLSNGKAVSSEPVSITIQ